MWRGFSRLTIGILAVLVLIGTTLETAAQEQPNPQRSPNHAVTGLLQKRHAVLSQLLNVQMESYQQGHAAIEDILGARRKLLEVELELATSSEDRIRLLEKSVRLAEELEQLVETKYETGDASRVDVFKLRAEHLKIQTDLAREREHIATTDREEKTFFTCPIHPKIESGGTGRCSICGMVLVTKIRGTDQVDRPTEKGVSRKSVKRNSRKGNSRPLDASEHVE